MKFISSQNIVPLLHLLTQLFFINTINSQGGYKKILTIDNSINYNIDDIEFSDNQLILVGDIFSLTKNRWGTLVAVLDTTGLLIWDNIIYDSTSNEDFNSNTPTKFGFNQMGMLMLPTVIFQKHDPALIITDSIGNVKLMKKYTTDNYTAFPYDIKQIDRFYYIFGISQRQNYHLDIFILKSDLLGRLIWIKYYGAANLEEIFGDVWINQDSTFTICAASSDEWYTPNEVTGWNKPWIFTIDTAGTILHSWKGDENDTRTNGRGPIYRASNGDYVIASYDVKMVYGVNDPVRTSPTITRLDSNFNLIWKLNLTNFTDYNDKIQDMVYDSARDQFIVAGDQRIFYSDGTEGADAWFEKVSGDGQIIWNKSDTAVYYGYGNQEHFTAGLAISPSGSIYVAGWVYSNAHHGQGWIIKVTPDGCSDTLCTITALQDQGHLQLPQITFWPNPVKDVFHISIPELFSKSTYSIFDITGKRVRDGTLNPGLNTLHSNLSPGLYFYTIRGQMNIETSGKFIQL